MRSPSATLLSSLLWLAAAAAVGATESRLNSACASDSDCEGGRELLSCRGGVCLCPEGHLPWVDACVRKRVRGQRCTRQIECTLSGE